MSPLRPAIIALELKLGAIRAEVTEIDETLATGQLCPVCGIEFFWTATRRKKRHCSDACDQKAKALR